MDNIANKLKKNFIRLYENQEIESMNYIFNKHITNNWFTHEELSFVSQVNLFDKEILNEVRDSWMSKSFE